MIEIDMVTLSLVSGAVLPLLVSLVVKADVDTRLKVVTNLVLSVIAGGVAFLITNDGAASWQELVSAMIQTYLASSITYEAGYKPSGIADKLNTKTADVGVGTRVIQPSQPSEPSPAATNEADTVPDDG